MPILRYLTTSAMILIVHEDSQTGFRLLSWRLGVGRSWEALQQQERVGEEDKGHSCGLVHSLHVLCNLSREYIRKLKNMTRRRLVKETLAFLNDRQNGVKGVSSRKAASDSKTTFRV